jgi:hypothetical protein
VEEWASPSPSNAEPHVDPRSTPIERLFAGHRPEHPNGRLLVLGQVFLYVELDWQ